MDGRLKPALTLTLVEGDVIQIQTPNGVINIQLDWIVTKRRVRLKFQAPRSFAILREKMGIDNKEVSVD